VPRHTTRMLAAMAVTSALVATGLAVATTATAATTETIYVSPSGSDTASGTSAGSAFQTLARAQEAVRAANSSSDVTVVVGDGTYVLSETLDFRTADGGRNGHSVTWKAADGAKPVISGGKSVTGWSDANGDGIWEAPLDSAIDFRQLYVDGGQALRSRMWVDYGKFSFSRSGFTVDANYASNNIATAWNALKALPASQQKRVELRSRASFTDRFAPFDAISNNVVTMRQPSWDNQTWGWDTINKPLHTPAFSLRNALAFVDEDNEWFYDTDAEKLYYKPASGQNPNAKSIVAPQLEKLVTISGDSADAPITNLAFQGLSFQYSSDTAANSDDGYASQQNGSVLKGYLYALTDPTTQDLPTSDQRTFDPSQDQAPLVRLIEKGSDDTYRYLDDASAVAAADLPRLIRLRDYPTMPLNNTQLAQWNAAHPNAPKQACAQGAYSIDCLTFESNRYMFRQTPASIQVSAAKDVSFTLNEFAHLGSKGLGIGMNDEAHASGVGLGAQHVSVVGNTFFDTAGSAIVAGGTNAEAARPSGDSRANRNLTITNNRVKKMGQDYFESSAVLATWWDGAEISHNELSDGPYDVIDTGWGWGVPDAGGNAVYQGRGAYIFNTRFAEDNPTFSRNIHVAKNVMWDFKKEGNDGGVLYHLGAAPGSSWDSNYLRGGDGTKLYFDEGTRYLTAKNNALDGTYYQAFANGFNENQGTPADNVGNSTRDNTIDGTWWLGGGVNAGPWCADSAKCDERGRYYNNRITNQSQLGINEYPLAAQKVIAEAGISAQYRKAGDWVGQSRGLDLSIGRDASGAQVLTATVANLGSTLLSDIALQISASDKVTLTPLTTAPTTLPPGQTATATWRITGSDSVTSGSVSANAAMTRDEIGGTSRETVSKSLSVVLGGAVSGDLLTAAPSLYAENQAVQSGGSFALQNKGRDIGEGGDEYTSIYKKDILGTTGSVSVKFDGGNTGWYRAGLSVRNDLSRMADRSVAEKSLGYAHLAIEPNYVALRYDADGDGVIDSQANAVATTARPLWVKLTRDSNTVTASYSTDGTTFSTVGQAPLTGADATLDAGVVQSSAGRSGNSGELGTSTARYSELRFNGESVSPDSAEAQQQILDRKTALRNAETTIDSMSAMGNGAQESARNLQQVRSNSGTWKGLGYRDADKSAGSFFQYEMNVDPTAPKNYLGVKYNGGDAGRSFDVLLNGVKLKTETISSEHGDTFFTEWDEIPASIMESIAASDSYKKDSSGAYVLDADGQKIPVVTVRFASNGSGMFVGGVYGLTTARALTFDTESRLTNLSFAEGTLTPAFSRGTTAYTLDVPSDTTQVTFDADPAVPSGLVKVGDILIDDTKPRTVTLNASGDTQVAVNSFAQDHTTSTSYVVTVKKAVAPSPTPEPTQTPTPTTTAVPTSTPTVAPTGGTGGGATSAPGGPSTSGQRTASASTSSVERGGTVTVTVRGLASGEQVTAVLRSDPITITGIPAADATGRVSFPVVIPENLAVGGHTITVTGADGTTVAVLPVQVYAKGTLAATGAQAPLGAALLAFSLLIAGAGVWALRRPRRRA